jgi:glucose/arabinose dehydrogenase
MTRAFFLGAGVLGAVLSGSRMLEPAREAPPPRTAPASQAHATSAAAVSVRLEPLASGLGGITAITSAGDGRLFVVLQSGTVVIWDGTQVLPTPFLDVSGKITCCGERGLLSTAFHPSYATNGFFFVDYTNLNGDTVIERYRVSASDANRAEIGSAAILLTIPQPFANHNGGQLKFGPDGFLYIGMGDGGSGDDPNCNAQSDASLLGKLLRIDVDQSVDTPPFHGIPPSNPFLSTGGPHEAWAKGLRNPWRFSFDRLNGNLVIGDVGQGSREEIDFQPASSHGGENYGWKVMEGTECGGGGTSGCTSPVPPCHDPSYTMPVLDYSHDAGRCSVTGGYVYRGVDVADLYGMYVYGDYCSGEIWAAMPEPGAWSTALLPFSAPNLTTFGEDSLGELYAGTQNGQLYRFASTVVRPVSVAEIAPDSGPTRGGQRVTISGANFTHATQVFFGATPAAVQVTSPFSLFAFAPRAEPGTVSITVVNPDTAPVVRPGAFTYTPLLRVTPPPGTRTIVREPGSL